MRMKKKAAPAGPPKTPAKEIRPKAAGAPANAAFPIVGKDIRFTTRGDTLYVLVMNWPDDQSVAVASLATSQPVKGKVGKVELLGHGGPLQFNQDAGGLKVKLPSEKPCDYIYTLKITGLKLT